MIVGVLRTLFNPHRPLRSRPAPSPRPGRLQVEELECRTVPSTFGSLLSGSHLASDIKSDLADIQADVMELTAALGPNPGQTVLNDLKTLSTDLTNVATDLANGNNAAAKDLATAVTDEAKLAS